MTQGIQDRIIFDVQNVANYCLAHAEAQGWTDFRNFLCSRPPFDYVELRYRDEKRDYTLEADILTKEAIFSLLGEQITVPFQGEFTAADASQYLDHPDARFILLRQIWGSGNGKVYLPGALIISMRPNGSVIVTDNNMAWMFLLSPALMGKYTEQEISKLQSLHLDGALIALATFNFLNCKNIEVVDSPPTRQMKRNAERHGQPAPPTIKTLRLPFVNRRHANSGEREDNSAPSALHIVRGHFKDYRESGLGRWQVKGLWWWSPQVRGQRTTGEVIKDYVVSVPEKKL